MDAFEIIESSSFAYFQKKFSGRTCCKHIKRQDGWTLLMQACNRGEVRIVKFLVSLGCNVNDFDVNGNYPLELAVLGQHENTVNYLLSCTDILIPEILLIKAVRNIKNLNIIKSLTERICINFVDIEDDSGKSVLIHSIISERSDFVKYFLNCGCDINKPDNQGRTPLIYAVCIGNIPIIKLLLSRNVLRNYRDKQNLSALDYSKMKNLQNISVLLQS